MTIASLLPFAFNLSYKILRQVDPFAFDHLQPYVGTQIQIQILPIGNFSLHIMDAKLSLKAFDPDSEPGCIIAGPLSAYLKMFSINKQFVPGNGLTIRGQTGVAQALFACIQNLDPDIAGLLEQYLPKTIVALWCEWLESLKANQVTWKETQKTHLKTYLQDEVQVLVPNILFEEFKQDIQHLQNRIHHLEKLANKTATNLTKSLLCSE